MSSENSIDTNLQTTLETATRRVTTAYSGDGTRLAEISTNLLDAQARLHAARQAEVTNLLAVVSHGAFSREARDKANARVIEILNLG